MKKLFALAAVGLGLLSVGEARALTIVLDMKAAAQGNTSDIFSVNVGTFNVAGFGFTAGQLSTVENGVLQSVRNDYYNIPTTATLPSSPIPAGFQLNIDFVLGDIGSAPSNGDSEYYYVQIGSKGPGNTETFLGQAGLSAVRTSAGLDGFAANHAIVGSILSDNINSMGGLSPSNALTSGNLTYSSYGIGGTVSHEIGHTLSLSHINKAGSLQPSGALGGTNLPPLMGTGAIDLPNNDRIGPREFSISGFDGQSGNAARAQIAQLVTAVGLRPVPEPTLIAAPMLIAFGLLRRTRRLAR